MADIGINVILTGLENLGEGIKNLGASAQEGIGKIALEFKGLGERMGELKDRFKAFAAEKWDQIWSAVKNGAQQLGLELQGMGKHLGTIAAVAAGAGLAAFGLAKKFANVSDEMKDMGEQFGLTTEQMSRLDYIAKKEGASVGELAGTFAKLGKDITKIADGSAGKKMAATWEKYGIEVKDAEGKLRSTEDVMLQIADVMAKAGSPTEKLGIATDLLGNRAAKLIPIFGDGAEALRKYMEESDKFGYTISTKAGEDGEKFNKALATMQLQLQGLVRSGLTPVMDKFSGLMSSMSDITKDTNIATHAFQGMVYIFKVLGTALSLISRSLNLVGQAFAAVFASIAAAASGNLKEALSILKLGVGDLVDQFNGIIKDFDRIWKDTTENVVKESEKAAKGIKKIEDGVKGAAKAMKQSAQTDLPKFADGLSKVAMAMDGGGGGGLMKVDTRLRGTLRGMAKGNKSILDEMQDDQSEAFKNLTEEQRAGFSRLATAVDGFATEFTSSINNMLWDTTRDWKEFFKSLGKFITATLLQEYISIPLSNGIKNMMGSLLGQAFGGAIGGAGGGQNLQPVRGGVAAAGGGVIPSGSWALVGERGPELISAAAGSRSVVPNHALGGMGGVTINQHFTAGVTQADIARLIPALRQNTMAAMADAQRRGG